MAIRKYGGQAPFVIDTKPAPFPALQPDNWCLVAKDKQPRQFASEDEATEYLETSIEDWQLTEYDWRIVPLSLTQISEF